MAETESVKNETEKMDGWLNVLTGLGIKGRDKRTGASYVYERMTKSEAEDLFGCDDMAEKVVDFLPEEMQREGFEITHDQDDEKLHDLAMEYFKKLGGPFNADRGLKWARLYGGAGVVMGINDGNEASEPVNKNGIRTIEFLNTLHKWELNPVTTTLQRDPTKPDFGMPTQYYLSPEQGGGEGSQTIVHTDRILRFDGARLPNNLFIRNNYWHDSVLTRFRNPLRNFQMAHDSAATLMNDFAQAVYKIKNLTEMIAQGRDDLVQKRLELVDRCRSVVQAIVLEDGEDFERKVTSLQGVPDLLSKIEQRLVQASKMPHTILLGESAGGLGNTGKSEERQWFDYVARQQEVNFKPQLAKIFKYIFLAKDGPTRGREPATWDIEFNSLFQMSEKEQAEIYKIRAEGDQIYITNGVVDPDEVAKTRFSDNDGELFIDLELRETQTPITANNEPVTPEAAEQAITAAGGAGEQLKELSLNGAQITSMVDVITKVATGELPRATGLEIITTGFPIPPEKAEAIMGEVGQGFTPPTPEPTGPTTRGDHDLTQIPVPTSIKKIINLDNLDIYQLLKLKKHDDESVRKFAEGMLDGLKKQEGE
jgi:phage-related protein (TIGR01555 family)